MFWIISYDIVNDKRRRRVMKALDSVGHRVQYSVFECDLNETRLHRLEGILIREIDPKTDSVRFYPLNEGDIPKIRLLGVATLERDQPYYIV